jgi:hypothetical protein
MGNLLEGRNCLILELSLRVHAQQRLFVQEKKNTYCVGRSAGRFSPRSRM